MDALIQKGEELGRLIAQTSEYQALQRANQRASEEHELNDRLNRLAETQRNLLGYLERGETPPEALRADYDAILGEAQGHPVYQALVAAQENFDRLMHRVNEAIARGIDTGEKSRIILPT